MLLKTEKYTKRKSSVSMTPEAQRILSSKAAFNSERERELLERIKKSLGTSVLIVNAGLVESSSQDAVARVTEGFQFLVGYTYHQLGTLGGFTYSEQQIANFVNLDEGALFDDVQLKAITPAADEVFSFITRQELLGARVTVKMIVDAYEAKPYGWHLPAIQVCIARLVGISKVIIALDGSTIKRTEIAGILRNTAKHAQTTITIQKQYDEKKVADFRDFCTTFFDDAQVPKDPIELVRFSTDKFQAIKGELSARLDNLAYPFVQQLRDPIQLINDVLGQPTTWYFDEFPNLSASLLAAKEDVIDPIRAFLAGPQKEIFDALLVTYTIL